MENRERMAIYNVFPTLAGSFTDWERHLIRASEMEFTWIFVNPIQTPGKSGSMYGIADYYGFNQLLVNKKSSKSPEEQVRAMIKEAEKLGQKVMIDLVINHCSVDSSLVKSHPRWFEWDDKGNVANPWADENGARVVWKDLAKFDYRESKNREELCKYFIKYTGYLAGLGFKGFRCDAAYQVPAPVWERLISTVKRKYPDALFIAETLGCSPDQTRETARAGFDYIFNSAKWWDYSGSWLMEQYNLTRDTVPSISFPESHDTARLSEELNGNGNGIKQRFLFTALFSSGVMIPIGFEFGFRKRLHVASTRPEDWESPSFDLRPFIAKVIKLKAEAPVFHEDGPAEIVPAKNPNVLLLWKGTQSGTMEALVILNKDITTNQRFEDENLYRHIRNVRTPLRDVSPEYPLTFIPSPFSCDLRPGQGIVLVTS